MAKPKTAKRETVSEPAPQTDRHACWWLVGVIVAAVAPYITALWGQFTLDDWDLIVRNPIIHSLGNIPAAFAHGFLPETMGKDLAYYRPLVTVSYQLNYALSGLNPFAFRLTNVLLNAIVAALVFFIARRLTRNSLIAGIAGIGFAVLPSHSEAVAWISGRTDIMSALFVLAGFLVFIKSCEDECRFSWSRGLLCSALFLCGLLSKENALSLLLLMAAYVLIFTKRINKLEMMKWVGALIVPIVICMLLRKHALGVSVVDHFTFMLKQRLMGVGIAYASYLRMMFLPQGLRLVYDVFPIGMQYPIIAYSAWLIPIGLLLAPVWLRKKAPVISLASFWMFICLLPVSNILPTSGPLPAERFCYLASVGSSFILGCVVWRLYQFKPKSVQVWPLALTILVAGSALRCLALSVDSNNYYTSNYNWARGVAETNTRIAMFRAFAGGYLEEAGEMKGAAKEYEAALKLQHGELPADYLANVSYRLGLVYVELGQIDQAANAFQRAVVSLPTFGRAWRNLGRANLQLGKYRGAVQAYQKAFKLITPRPEDRKALDQAYRKLRVGG